MSRFDTALTINMEHITRRKLRATALALGLSGESEVVRSILTGALPALDEIPGAIFRSQRQFDVYKYMMQDDENE